MPVTGTRRGVQARPARSLRFRLGSEESGGTVTIHEFDVGAGAALPLAHSHDAYEETIYGPVEGVVTFTVDGTPVARWSRTRCRIRRGEVHSFANTGDARATALAIITPGSGPEYFREVAAIVEAAAGGPPDPSQPSARRCGATASPPQPDSDGSG